MDILKNEVAYELKNCNEHKSQVLRSAFVNTCFGLNRKFRPKFPHLRVRRQLDPEIQIDVVPLSPSLSTLQHDENVNGMKTYVPGRVLYIQKFRLWNDGKDDLSVFSRTRTKKFSTLLPWNARNDKFSDPISLSGHASTISNKVVSLLPKKVGKYVYVPSWTRRDEFGRIIVSSTMVSDHWPLDILTAMSQLELDEDLRIEVAGKGSQVKILE